MKKLIAVLLLSLCSSHMYGREFKGFIITKEGDTISGIIVTGKNVFVLEEVGAQISISFKENGEKKKRLTPKEIDGYGLISPDEQDTMIYKKVVYQRTQFIPKITEVTHFMEVISFGEIELYHYIQHVPPGHRAYAQAQAEADAVFLKLRDKQYAIEIPSYRTGNWQKNVDYFSFIKDQLGAEHPLISQVSPGISFENLVEAIIKYNEQ